MHKTCKDCEATLWSVYSQEKGICPDCENFEDLGCEEDLEARLEKSFEHSVKVM